MPAIMRLSISSSLYELLWSLDMATNPTLAQRIIRAPTEAYPEAGYCIYCGSRKPPLTDEHIFPYGLGGHMLFPKASCEQCQKIINRIETVVVREMLRPYRLSIGLVGKHRDSKPQSIPLDVLDRGTGAIDKTILAVDQYPTTVLLFILTPPSIIAALSRSKTVWRPWLYLHDHESLSRLFAAMTPGKAINAGRFYPVEFCRVLAKMAYGYAVADGIPSGYSFLLQDIILGHNLDVFREDLLRAALSDNDLVSRGPKIGE
jgi:hypothetical protein